MRQRPRPPVPPATAAAARRRRVVLGICVLAALGLLLIGPVHAILHTDGGAHPCVACASPAAPVPAAPVLSGLMRLGFAAPIPARAWAPQPAARPPRSRAPPATPAA